MFSLTSVLIDTLSTTSHSWTSNILSSANSTTNINHPASWRRRLPQYLQAWKTIWMCWSFIWPEEGATKTVAIDHTWDTSVWFDWPSVSALMCSPSWKHKKKYLVRICFCVLKSEYEVETFCPFFWHACNLRVVGCLTNLIEFVFTDYSSVSHVTKSWHVFL